MYTYVRMLALTYEVWVLLCVLCGCVWLMSAIQLHRPGCWGVKGLLLQEHGASLPRTGINSEFVFICIPKPEVFLSEHTYLVVNIFIDWFTSLHEFQCIYITRELLRTCVHTWSCSLTHLLMFVSSLRSSCWEMRVGRAHCKESSSNSVSMWDLMHSTHSFFCYVCRRT